MSHLVSIESGIFLMKSCDKVENHVPVRRMDEGYFVSASVFSLSLYSSLKVLSNEMKINMGGAIR